MNPQDIDAAAAVLVDNWNNDGHIDALPQGLSPPDVDAGYAVQNRFAELLGVEVVGWKIAATSAAGQNHIQVTHPLIGRLFADRVYDSPASILLRDNRMLVAEGEFTFRLGRDIPAGDRAWTRERVMDHVDALFPAIELPDSRFLDFAAAGAPALVADNACGREYILGAEVAGRWRDIAFERFPVKMWKNGEVAVEGSGADVLGDPRDALAWLVNECGRLGIDLRRGQLVTTGVTGRPLPIVPGDRVRADFGILGSVEVSFPVAPQE
jgi:2-keto-4-pentenoate hydratase